MSEESDKKIDALINLLDDPDDRVYEQIKDQILSYGMDIIPNLENAWENMHFGLHFQTRVEDIIHQIQLDAVYHDLKKWKQNGAQDLLEGCIILSKYQYPDLEEELIHETIDQLKRDIWLELNDNLTGFEQVKVLNHIFYDVYGFSGNKKNFHAPQNSYINTVVESRKGNPLSLGIIYLIVAKKLDLPVQGVNLPSHFVLAYLDRNNLLQFTDATEQEKQDGVMFYINPFSRGTIFNRREIEKFLEQLDLPQENAFFRPCHNIDILKRMITNLIYSYQKADSPEKMEELKKLFGALM